MAIDLDPIQFEASGAWTVHIRIPAGTVGIRTHDQPSMRVHVTGLKNDGDIEVTTAERDRQLVIAHSGKGRFGRFNAGVQIDLTVPSGTSLRLKGQAVDVHADGHLGDVHLSTASGDSHLQAVDGELHVNSASGDVHAEHVNGSLVVRVASGDIAIGQADSDVSVQSVSGDVHIDCLRAGKTSIKAVSGDIELAIERGLRMHLDLSSMSGATRPELDLRAEEPASDQALALDVSVRTLSGDISVRRSDRVPA